MALMSKVCSVLLWRLECCGVCYALWLDLRDCLCRGRKTMEAGLDWRLEGRNTGRRFSERSDAWETGCTTPSRLGGGHTGLFWT